ncbi:MAG: diguanylate cyclase/phosphodiesterase (GGDEF & EAL domains) with PAS/PAC sensor(s) [uncultured Gemmatimonadetes bacterium]|uniref:Diguanylate cyclase/phosphodiesterase (GGDEF & EAL domains) with PAS/PAC sensor(S) n=1 Tax=uncultured Gemmatimonadota bacterium TaxID=203437 RepID=A0A6J4L0H8_9BACT|nr:MAG: diguanylate cyclase/phosphodiesterase (GGDEF & EAL domains) with PAS/PAC sensor(s) [uncultured Gemmatimonadota bacterium]
MTLDHVIETRAVRTSFQSIFRLADGAVLGCEALSRGVEGGDFALADRLFGEARRQGRTSSLERLCCAVAIHRSSAVCGDSRGKLFLNLCVDEICRRENVDFIEVAAGGAGLRPSSIVVEITEGHGVSDWGRLRAGIRAWRAAGFALAIDDVGSGHSDLRIVAEVEPEYLKIDRSLVAEIDSRRGLRAAVSALVVMGSELSSVVIAEGIETREELATLRGLGVEAGQGYFLARPALQPNLLSAAASAELATAGTTIPIPLKAEPRRAASAYA